MNVGSSVGCLGCRIWMPLTCSTKCLSELYIVYMGSLPGGDYLPEAHHFSMLQSVSNPNTMSGDQKLLVRSYQRSFNGFAAWLTDQECEKLNAMEEVISVFPNTVYQPLTTRSWDFLGFTENITRKPSIESDVIIGLLDTGIASDSPSFSDEGFSPVPKKWKGGCQSGGTVICNKKVIGAKDYTGTGAGDEDGHGTHTASTAAGNEVKGASFYGLAEGTARGGVPSARIAAYKVCSYYCQTADILAGFDDAIADGVDILSVSLGSSTASSFRFEPVVIGSYHALEKGVLTVQAGGNDGPEYSTVTSFVPWLLSAGASTTDRKMVDKVVLGDGRTLTGKSINSFTPIQTTEVPLIYGLGNKAETYCDDSSIANCISGCLDLKTAKGNIVVCESTEQAWDEVYRVGGAGLVAPFDIEKTQASISPLPGLNLSPQDFKLIKAYASSASGPTATLQKSIAVKNPSAPSIASFSSRGPNRDLPEINKPDLVAPGVEILAGFSPIAPVTDFYFDNRSSKYTVMSGTSMACPHVAGAAAYVKTVHPDWSPSAIKSALMTSARPMHASDKEFSYGSGQINPARAANPGLIYDLSHTDYVNYICAVYRNTTTLESLLGKNPTCPDQTLLLTTFNYPSLTFPINLNVTKTINVTFNRIVTNVGLPNSTYTAKVVSDPHLKIEVAPDTLSFKSLNETQAFTVKVTGEYPAKEAILSSSLVWSDRTHSVRSPIVVYKLLQQPDRGD
uniref:Uncharacterized protein n=1 Tax=Kalanchoe fedtschenkoi TaxID=63787 RepID=A0A7N0TGR3_KALFE